MKGQEQSALDRLDFPSVEEISAIAEQDDPAIRNLWITWSYYRLNLAMEAVIGHRDLSWCGFATWASKTAGIFIRQDSLSETRSQKTSPNAALRRAVRVLAHCGDRWRKDTWHIDIRAAFPYDVRVTNYWAWLGSPQSPYADFIQLITS